MAGLIFSKPEITQREIYISLQQSGKLSPQREAAERCALCKMCSAKLNFGNFKLEKNVSFGRNFLVDKDFKTKKTFGPQKRAKIRIENFAELAQSSWKLK